MAIDPPLQYQAFAPRNAQRDKTDIPSVRSNLYLFKLLEVREEKKNAEAESGRTRRTGSVQPLAVFRRWLTGATAGILMLGLVRCSSPTELVDVGYKYDGRAVKVEKGQNAFVSKWRVHLDTVVTTGPDHNRYRLATAKFYLKDSLDFEWNFTRNDEKRGLVPDSSVKEQYSIQCTAISDTGQSVVLQGWKKPLFEQ